MTEAWVQQHNRGSGPGNPQEHLTWLCRSPLLKQGLRLAAVSPQPLEMPRSAHPEQGRGKSTLPFPAGVQQDEIQGRLLLLHLLKDPLHADAVLRGIGLWSINGDHVVPPRMFIPVTSIVEYSWEQEEERMSHDANPQVYNQLPTATSHLLS